MLPTHLTRWFDRYGIDHTVGWEIVETVTQTGSSLDDIRDSSHMFDLTVDWAVALIEAVYDEPTRPNTQAYLFVTLPIVYALRHELTNDQRERLMKAVGDDTPVLIDAMHIALHIKPQPNKYYNDPMMRQMRARHERIDQQKKEGLI